MTHKQKGKLGLFEHNISQCYDTHEAETERNKNKETYYKLRGTVEIPSSRTFLLG